MSKNGQQGFNVIELVVVTTAVTLLALVLVTAMTDALKRSHITAVRARGRDIYVAITGANTEREPLGLPPVWPADPGFYTNAAPGDISSLNFATSTDYFRRLFDEERVGTKAWSPYVTDFVYAKLAGAGVPACETGKLTAENNMWTIAKNVPKEVSDSVPLLVTRNIDAASLPAKVAESDATKVLRFDNEWETPFGPCYFVIVSAGGACYAANKGHMSYREAFRGQKYDATVEESGQPARHPLAYLTPTRTVVPGEPARVDRVSGGGDRLLRKPWRELTLIRTAGWAALCVYLVLWVFGAGGRNKRPDIGLGLAHGAALVLWGGFVFGPFLSGVCFRWPLLALALLAQVAGLAWVAVFRKGDPAAVRRGVMWLVSVPLLAVVGGGALLVGGLILAAVLHLR